MAENKNRIIVYRDWITTFNLLSDEEAGRLIKHFFMYVNDMNPEPPDKLTALLFEPIKQTLKRDLKSYEAICLKNRDNINIRWNKNNTTVYDRIRPDTKNTDRDRDNDIDIDKEKKKKRKPLVFTPPTIEEVKTYFTENGYDPAIGIKAWMGYDAANWFDSKGNPVKNWKQKMVNVWFKEEHKIKAKPELIPQFSSGSER